MSINTATLPRQTIGNRYGSTAPLVWLAIALSAFLLMMITLGSFDDRLIKGISIWDKPGKFALSIALHAFTLAWGLQLASRQVFASKSTRWAIIVFIAAVIFEMSWMTFQASRGEASHFNRTTTLASAMYAIMGIAAVSMTVVTVFLGWKIARSGNTPMHMATGYGFVMSGALTTIVAGYMSSGTGHSIGGDLTDATGLAFFHWSTTGGDLRVPHFAALHIAQAMPFLAWLMPDKRLVLISGIGAIVVTAALFVQALMGIPFLAV
ncbi:MAG: hypothetical protein ACRCU5_15915 [Rhizobiaceae bacterium]